MRAVTVNVGAGRTWSSSSGHVCCLDECNEGELKTRDLNRSGSGGMMVCSGGLCVGSGIER